MKKYFKALEQDKRVSQAYQKALYFFNLIWEDIQNSDKLYGKEDAIALKRYYSYIKKETAYFNYIQHRYAERVKYLIINVKKNIKILDAGCGTGSEAILSGILGGNVFGVDFDKKRLNIANKRVKNFENKLKMKINVKFYSQNILKHSDNYDLIWVNEAISHINPTEDFLKISFNNLNSRGKLIIADANKINPYMFYLSKMEQKKYKGIYRIKKDSITGEQISYAIERIFTITHIKNLLSKRFKSIEIYPIGYVPFQIFKLLPKICKELEQKFLRKAPLINLISTGYIIICTKT